VDARQRVKLSLTNRSIGLIPPPTRRAQQPARTARRPPEAPPSGRIASILAHTPPPPRPACGRSTWWSQRGARTRSHPELGRENPPRQWYCVLRRGRVGRRQVRQPRSRYDSSNKTVENITISHSYSVTIGSAVCVSRGLPGDPDPQSFNRKG
jgi:hypothetical protein